MYRDILRDKVYIPMISFFCFFCFWLSFSVSFDPLSYRIVSYRILSYAIVSYHIVSYRRYLSPVPFLSFSLSSLSYPRSWIPILSYPTLSLSYFYPIYPILFLVDPYLFSFLLFIFLDSILFPIVDFLNSILSLSLSLFLSLLYHYVLRLSI